ncbi:MAG TPA: GGDEF domain-containing protein [Pseudogracilibacillus sp.]|nr:GGDEF domain-containing protein [Pseudogracilibacillus sp.]
MIIKELFVNLCILVSVLFFYTQISQKFPLTKESSLRKKILLGIGGGILSNLLMQFSIQVESTLVDLRHIPYIMLAYYGGAVPAFISMVFISVGRLLISTEAASYLTNIIIFSAIIFTLYISKLNLTKKVKIFLVFTFNNLLFSVVFMFIVEDTSLEIKVLAVYWTASLIAGYVSFYILYYIRRSQMLFDKYKKDSTIDELTGLNNVRKFEDTFNELVKSVRLNDQRLSLLYIDIDFFKKINDTYGHEQGDEVLKELGSLLSNSTRPFDIVSRNGGEEFTALLLDCEVNRAIEIAEKLRENIKKYSFPISEKESIQITASIGVACYPDTTLDPKYLVSDADKALYQAKNAGRDRVMTWQG